MANPLRIAFMGTPDFSVPALKALIDAGHEVACVYSQPPRPAGPGLRAVRAGQLRTPDPAVPRARAASSRTAAATRAAAAAAGSWSMRADCPLPS